LSCVHTPTVNIMPSQYINSSSTLFTSTTAVVEAPEVVESQQQFLAGYTNLPQTISNAIDRDEIFYLAVELYLPTQDEIYATPERAVYCFSSSRFKWRNRLYRDVIKGIPELKKFIGKTFNTFSIDMLNVERGKNSGSYFLFKNLIRGFRVAVRIIFPDQPHRIENSRLIWWGRIVNSEDVTTETVKINCSQEIGDFSYELATETYGQSCPLIFAKGDCLGNQTFEQKGLAFQTAFNLFGQGGCNHTNKRCIELANQQFYQGQNVVTITGQFYRETITKSGWWIFKRKHKTITPVQFSSQNQTDGEKENIALILGRAQVQLHPFTWADVGSEIHALMGACKGPIQGFYNVIGRNTNLTLISVVQHLGELGGVGTQQPPNYFPASGYNSKLAFLEVGFGGSPLDDEPEQVPAVTAIVKGMLIPVRDSFGVFHDEWTYNPVWITRFLTINFPYTVIKPTWFNEDRNSNTADYCFNVVEDDTGAEIPVITGSARHNYDEGIFNRYSAVGRYNMQSVVNGTTRQDVRSTRFLDSGLKGDEFDRMPLWFDDGEPSPELLWGNGLGFGAAPLDTQHIYLQYRYTCNGIINQKSKLSDILFSLILPTFKGFLRFNQFGKIDIDCRKPADNTFLRLPTVRNESPEIPNPPVGSTEIAVGSVRKFSETYGWLLIGVGIGSTEIARIKGIRYVNGCDQTVVSVTADNLQVTFSQVFVERAGGPAEVIIDFDGTPVAGDKIELKFTEPNGDEWVWDYYVENDTDTLELITRMFQVRLMASPSFRETWTAETYSLYPNRIYIRCQTGYIILDRLLKNNHYAGEEVLRVVEVYEDGKDEVHSDGVKDNIKEFTLNSNRQETFHGVTGTYTSAVQDFAPVKIQPRVAWDAAEQERNLNLLDLDLRFVDNYRQAALLTKSAAIQFVDGNLPATLVTGIKALFHEENDIIAVRHQTMEGVSYTPFSVEDISYTEDSQTTSLGLRLYLSAMFDERVAKEEKFLEATLTKNTNPTVTPPPSFNPGGYSTTGTGDGGLNSGNRIKYETQPYKTLPKQQLYSPYGRDNL
jgi:hypothetical protein